MKKKLFLFIVVSLILTLGVGLTGCSTDVKTLAWNDVEINEVFADFNTKVSPTIKNSFFDKLDSSVSEVESMRAVKGINEKSNIDNEIVDTDIIYDFNDRPVFLLCAFSEGGYAIINRLTNNSIEYTANGNSPYGDYKNEKKLYGGFGNYFVKVNGSVINLINAGVLTKSEQDFYSQLSEYIVISEAIENEKELNSMVMPLTSNADRDNNTTIMSGGEYFKNLTSGSYYPDKFIPSNDGSSCGIVAATMVLQYYERTGTHVIPKAFLGTIKNEQAQDLHDELNDLTWGGAFGENYTKNVMTGLSKFYNKYPEIRNENLYKVTTKYNTCYDNMKGAIDNGFPAVGMTGTGNGYYKIGGQWKSTSAARHQMVVYGYCTTNKNTLKDFVCHSGWGTVGTSKMYVYKLNFLSNFTCSLEEAGVV